MCSSMKPGWVRKTLLITVFIGFVSLVTSDPQPQMYSLGGIIGTAKNVTTGIVKKIPKYIPTPDEVFNSGKDLFAGYPFEVLFDAINKICSGVNAVDAIQPKITPDIQNMTFRLITKCKNYTFPILKADDMWKSSYFNSSQKVVIIISGWGNTINESSMIYDISKAYLCRGGVNIVGLDAAEYVNTLYTWSALNVEEIGEILAKGLIELRKIVPLENIHLIGHSLGANIAGYAGKFFQNKTEELLPRITALDPARPCFNEGEKLSGVERGDAELVDVIHSNPGVLGKQVPVGDLDYYPGGLGSLQRGCFTITCSHSRAFQYYAETVYPGNEDNFMAVRCNSLTNVKRGLCIGKAFRMGYGLPLKLKGNYFSDTESKSPFGPSQTKAPNDVSECGLCPSEELRSPPVKF